MITDRCPPPDWIDLDAEEQSEIRAVALAERVDYLMAAATAGAGSQLTPQEATRLLQLCHDLELPDRETRRILAAARKARANASTLLDPSD